MYYLNRKEFNKNMALEESIQDKRKKFFSILPSGKSMRQIARECEQEIGFDFNSIYQDFKNKPTSCGAFCNR